MCKSDWCSSCIWLLLTKPRTGSKTDIRCDVKDWLGIPSSTLGNGNKQVNKQIKDKQADTFPYMIPMASQTGTVSNS